MQNRNKAPADPAGYVKEILPGWPWEGAGNFYDRQRALADFLLEFFKKLEQATREEKGAAAALTACRAAFADIKRAAHLQDPGPIHEKTVAACDGVPDYWVQCLITCSQDEQKDILEYIRSKGEMEAFTTWSEQVAYDAIEDDIDLMKDFEDAVGDISFAMLPHLLGMVPAGSALMAALGDLQKRLPHPGGRPSRRERYELTQDQVADRLQWYRKGLTADNVAGWEQDPPRGRIPPGYSRSCRATADAFLLFETRLKADRERGEDLQRAVESHAAYNTPTERCGNCTHCHNEGRRYYCDLEGRDTPRSASDEACGAYRRASGRK